jgi:polyisoprenoid-binding protein YceI
MKKLLLLTILLLTSLTGSIISVDSENSKITFSANKFLFVGIQGVFKNFSGSIDISKGKIVAINGSVKTDSIDTDDEKRDVYLKDIEYFNSKKYPFATLDLNEFSEESAKGTLKIKKTSQKVSFSIEEISIHENGATLELKTTINRQDFGLHGFMDSVISDEVDIWLDLSF